MCRECHHLDWSDMVRAAANCISYRATPSPPHPIHRCHPPLLPHHLGSYPRHLRPCTMCHRRMDRVPIHHHRRNIILMARTGPDLQIRTGRITLENNSKPALGCKLATTHTDRVPSSPHLGIQRICAFTRHVPCEHHLRRLPPCDVHRRGRGHHHRRQCTDQCVVQTAAAGADHMVSVLVFSDMYLGGMCTSTMASAARCVSYQGKRTRFRSCVILIS